MSARAFVLQRDEDVSGVSGTGVVAEGVLFSDGTVSLRWTSTFPTSVVFHDRGMESVEAIHGHDGRTRIVFTDDSRCTVNGEPQTWEQMYRAERERSSELNAWHVLVMDLDRCEHGRHEGDVCGNCGGPSAGNPLLPPGIVIGTTLHGTHRIVVPERADKGRIDAWRAEVVR